MPEAPKAAPSQPRQNVVELSKRYDVYCDERKQEIVYRMSFFLKGLEN